ncbi:hypothetical protein GCM10010399_14490 [Dactylosporangium fulvum]|uniref:FAD-dependent oxidoreductase n=1 Tax=Dactylosporangium fulvum TaxID=53359 RepID=A0ABY5VR59_9ACTN|nr:FAD-dependent oxidoreductase [Dactylosporangium fulvum]UWP80267.1 FAD-dependent oxidoreductase [Dactylosporangium fulvum]
MSTPPRVLVVGAGAAGSAAAVRLARAGAVEVMVVGAEPRMPYNRTTVNKGLLAGAVADDDITLSDLDELPVQWLLGRRATALDAVRRSVKLDGGATINADAIVLATGAHPRTLPASVAPAIGDRVVSLRTAEDTHRLRHLHLRAYDQADHRRLAAPWRHRTSGTRQPGRPPLRRRTARR